MTGPEGFPGPGGGVGPTGPMGPTGPAGGSGFNATVLTGGNLGHTIASAAGAQIDQSAGSLTDLFVGIANGASATSQPSVDVELPGAGANCTAQGGTAGSTTSGTLEQLFVRTDVAPGAPQTYNVAVCVNDICSATFQCTIPSGGTTCATCNGGVVPCAGNPGPQLTVNDCDKVSLDIVPSQPGGTKADVSYSMIFKQLVPAAP
ncbi:MAG: hypothetical protein ACREQI_01210 [Candidatus Binataceae bacterium]